MNGHSHYQPSAAWPHAAGRTLMDSRAAGPRAGRPLMDQVSEAIRTRHYSRRTEEAYAAWIRRYILFHGKRHPAQMGAPEIGRFLTHLAVRAKVSASTQNQALSAILFLYREVLHLEIGWVEDLVRAKGPRRLPVVLSRQEARDVLARLQGTTRLMATLLYGSGLRLLECARLRVKDLDFGLNQITVRGGKGDKDRVTMLPAALKPALVSHLQTIRRRHQEDLDKGGGWVALPGGLERKYPNAGRSWEWQWVFPATRTYVDPATGRRHRHHLHESVLQRAVREAAIKAGIDKPVSCHTFREASAWCTTFLLGVDLLFTRI